MDELLEKLEKGSTRKGPVGLFGKFLEKLSSAQAESYE